MAYGGYGSAYLYTLFMFLKEDNTSTHKQHLFMFQAMAQDIIHVLVQALKTPIARPNIGIVGWQQPFNGGLQIRQKLPVFPSNKTCDRNKSDWSCLWNNRILKHLYWNILCYWECDSAISYFLHYYYSKTT